MIDAVCRPPPQTLDIVDRVETLREYRGGNKRLMRYCPTCWEHRTKAMAELKKGRPG